MKSGGPYFSQALLNAILSHSVRWCRGEPGMDQLLAPFDNGAMFAKEAVKYLFEDIQQGNTRVPTIQALLLLSAQECGRGNRTQAWLYSGMAFRLIDDMGITVNGKRHADGSSFSAEDIEIRNRLFWSCYFWDKLISLYFGRSPSLQHSDISPPRVLCTFEPFLASHPSRKLSQEQWTTQPKSKPGPHTASYPHISPNKPTPSPASSRCAASQKSSIRSKFTCIIPTRSSRPRACTNAP